MFSNDWLNPLAQTLKQLGSKHVLVVHAEDGLDEISIAAKTNIAELKDGRIENYSISPEDFGMHLKNISELSVSGVDESLNRMQSVLDNNSGAAKDIVCLNAGAAIYAAGLADSIQDGISKASSHIVSGAAKQKFEQLIDHSQSLKL